MSNKDLIAIFLAFAVMGCSIRSTVEDGVAAYEKEDFVKAGKIFSENQSNPISMYYLAMLYYGGLGVPKNSEAAIEWLERASKLGNKKAIAFLGKLYLVGNAERNIKKDPIYGMDLLYKAAKLGESDAYVSIGDYYKVEKKNIDMAQIYYTMAGNNLFARFNLIGIYEKKNQVRAAFDNVNQMLSSTGKNVDPLLDLARVRLAEYYYYGYGVMPNAKLSAEALLPIIKSNSDSPASTNGKSLYAWLLFRGEGVNKDPGRAVMLWLESIDSKFSSAQTLPYIGLALAYSTGYGANKDLVKARNYFNQSAWNLDGGGYWYAKLASEGFLGENCPSMDKMWIMSPKITGDYRYNSIAKEAFISAAKCLMVRAGSSKSKASNAIDIENANKFYELAKEIGYNNVDMVDSRLVAPG